MCSKHFRLTPIAMVCAVSVHSIAIAQETELPAVVVSASKSTPPDANRLGVGVQETPQAITAIGADLMRAQGVDQLEDVMRNVPGMTQSAAHAGIFSNYVLRGFQLDNANNYFRDGLRFDRQSQISLQNIEQVEVIRGPASLQYGKLAPGGLVNFVTKKPLATRKHEATLYANQFGQLEGGFDSTGKLTESGNVLYRLNVEAKKLDSFRDHVDGDAYFIAPAFTFNLSDTTVMDVLLEHGRHDTIRDPGQPATVQNDLASVTRLDPSAFHGEKSAKNLVHNTSGALRLNHRLNAAWELRADYSGSRFDRDMYYTINLPVTNSSVPRRTLAAFTDARSDSVRVEAFGNFATGELKHKLLAGMDRLKRRVDDITTSGTSLSPVDLFNPVPTGNATYSLVPESNAKTRSTDTGIYVQDQMAFGPWSVMLGLRHDRLKENNHEEILDLRNKHEATQTSPGAGLLYHVTPKLALYANYSRSLDSNLATDDCGRSYDPSRGSQYEAGVKGFAFDNGLQWAVSAFDLMRSNGLSQDPSGAKGLSGNILCQVQGAKQRSTGVEFEVSGRPTKALRLHAAYSRLNARFTEDTDPLKVGNKLRNAPEQSARLWAEYGFTGAWQGLFTSLGMSYVGKRFADDKNTLTIPSYMVWDAGVRYALSKADTLQLAVSNLTDRRYVESAVNTNLIIQGEPRTVSVRYIRKF